MIIKIHKRMLQTFGQDAFRKWGLGKDGWNWKEEGQIDLTEYSKSMIDDLEERLKEHPTVRGVGAILKDIQTWKNAQVDSAVVRARTLYNFAALLKTYIDSLDGHRVYSKWGQTDDTTLWVAYYVNQVVYCPAQTGSYRHPAYVKMELIWEEFGGRCSKREIFYQSDAIGKIAECLARKGYYGETGELRWYYNLSLKKFNEICPQIGKQYWAIGTGVDDLDGNPNKRGWGRYLSSTIQLASEGSPTRCVIDVFYESDDTDRKEKDVDLDPYFWKRRSVISEDGDGDTDLENEDITEDTYREPEIPIHPLCAVFDLQRHLRLRVHVEYLTEYVYDKTIADRLILPDELKTLVTLLIEHNSRLFTDIVRGKSGGAVVLLVGLPGTGKTLTAEVYAESEERALYSVQCSQLGVNADELEDELLKVFARARRWNAVMLLDEADVYIHERGNDMNQNAIVGVFLRVLEYQASVLFLTSNRPDDVDDAIASRCIARITYPVPTVEQQKLIWRSLATVSNIKITDEAIEEIASKNQTLTGRDVKNLLKLANLYDPNGVTFEVVEFVKKFKSA